MTIFLNGNGKMLRVKVGFDLGGYAGTVSLKQVSREITLRQNKDVIFNLDEKIHVETIAVSSMLAIYAFPVLSQNGSSATIVSVACEGERLIADARALLGVRSPHLG
ncbi:MAG: hypothetical protein WCD70_00930 [Alphaproteobacteria bacterium]